MISRAFWKNYADKCDHVIQEQTARIEALEAEVNQLQAKLHCVCGSPIDHSAYEGHSPVSMYDHALDRANARVLELEDAIRKVRRVRYMFRDDITENEVYGPEKPE